MVDSINMQKAIELLQRDNPGRNVRDEMMPDILKGTIKFTVYEPKEFYLWCKHWVDKDKNSSSPLNWLNLACYGKIGLEDGAGIPEIIKAISKTLLNRQYEFVIDPAFLTSIQTKEMIDKKMTYFSTKGKFKFSKKNNYFYFLTENNQKILGQFCWIIGDIKND